MSLQKRIKRSIPHYEAIVEELRKFDSGGYGEQYVRSVLQEEFGDRMVHFSNYWLHNHELDLLSVTDGAAYLFEIKNIRGHVELKENPPQLVRTREDGTFDTFRCPVSQLESNLIHLRSFFTQLQLDIPIYAAVVFAFHNADIVAKPRKHPIVIGRDVCRLVWNTYPPKKEPTQKIVQLLTENRERRHYYPKLASYNLTIEDLVMGVFCPNCDHLPMTRLSYKWYCPKCQRFDKHAHEAALFDYYELISNKISTSTCCQYLLLRNRYEAKRILKQNSVKTIGNNRSTQYILQF